MNAAIFGILKFLGSNVRKENKGKEKHLRYRNEISFGSYQSYQLSEYPISVSKKWIENRQKEDVNVFKDYAK